MPMDAERRAYLESMGLPALDARGHDLLRKMALSREWIGKLKAELSNAGEHVETLKARILLSPAYKESRPNETIRAAWLLAQQGTDADFAAAIRVYRDFRRNLDAAEADAEALEAEYKLVITEIRLATAELQFLGGGE